ncbi:MAG: PilT/PilU family type 4a pilus ATPase [Acidobacteria bacterium]|nr:MAG: PilT/PilU family type 4a pilus ATPase [Acidobacteriota bacterium]REK07086.1 MAG: PilT/PilU family type 4a pilus ATPase [Acidobacteriota bacterium]
MQVDDLLRVMMEVGASDLHLKPARPPLLRINGRIQPMETADLKPEEIGHMLSGILQPHQKTRLERDFSVDLGYGVPGLARFRCNIYLQRGTLAASFRLIPYDVQTIEGLLLPDVLFDLCDLNQGLVLVTGPTGSGKSTTLAAMIKHITFNRPVNIITIEDPMEFLVADAMATVSQREVGTDTPSFREALRNVLRQDPDVIMVGEMRDPETIGTAISAAETGHLVFSTLHTNNATQTVDRILDSFPAEQQAQVRSQLSHVLRAVLSMKLVRRADGEGRIAALEILRNSPKIAKAIEVGKTTEIHEEIETSVAFSRMQSMNQSLLALLVHGEITYEEAMEQSTDPDDLSLKLRKMFPRIEERSGDDDMSPSPADFSEILELQQFRRLYEEQEEKNRIQMNEKEDELDRLRKALQDREEQIQQTSERLKQGSSEMEKLRNDYQRLKTEAQQKIDKLMERIKELNQRLVTK